MPAIKQYAYFAGAYSIFVRGSWFLNATLVGAYWLALRVIAPGKAKGSVREWGIAQKKKAKETSAKKRGKGTRIL
ncbi:hypothetical protein HYDPIDRAFT_116646 [Hydnomerulius pinastri MD-312]|uniref:Unplaced genomic scaffold scaffold_38, whole genome shotgun sequence n=1 Tax=Hydnomerulius pinastri MD-312 TaxID=994086 RepID=A0A0C9V5T0_9AGAM|nr:hypothetical protein HYDPIDRAFT_117135 [Hydnomerulius pinastri MD-312]KIJ60949.1 hypothetical protein HYDPIDRAFT_116646 [Hydnomerulius pinastri MD-312]